MFALSDKTLILHKDFGEGRKIGREKYSRDYYLFECCTLKS